MRVHADIYTGAYADVAECCSAQPKKSRRVSPDRHVVRVGV